MNEEKPRSTLLGLLTLTGVVVGTIVLSILLVKGLGHLIGL